MLVINNAGPDLILVYGLNAGDVVKVYSAAADGTLIAKATVSSGQTQVIMTVSQLGETGGYIYVTVTNVGLGESSTTEKAFLAE